MSTESSRAGNAYEEQRYLVLETLRRAGPMGIAELPGGWPVTRFHINGILNDLADTGVVRFVWDPAVPGRRRVRITAAGEKLLDGAAPIPAAAAVTGT